MNRFLPFYLLFLPFLNFAQGPAETYVPDDNFERQLISLGYDDEFDDYVLTANIENVQELNIYHNGFRPIYDFTGIEAFTSLNSLRISKFSLTPAVIDPIKIKEIIANKLNLEELDLSGYNYGTIDLSKHEFLKIFDCRNCNLEELDVSDNLLLEELNLYNNNLKSLDISNNENLKVLSASLNEFDEIDASSNPNLTNIDLTYNELERISVKNGNNAILEYFAVSDNYYLQCIEIDDLNGIGSFWRKDIQANYNNDCSGPQEDIDADDDGILDIFDNCPDTPAGEDVSQKGCAISQSSHLPIEYLDLSIGSEPCWESTRNGYVNVSIKEDLQLPIPVASLGIIQIKIDKDGHPFSRTNLTVNTPFSQRGLSEGDYTVCLSKENRGELCLDVSYSATSTTISTSIAIQKPNLMYTISVAGSTSYMVQVNNQSYAYESETVDARNIEIPFEVGINDVTITGIRDCELYDPDLTYIPDDNLEQHFIDLGYDDILDNHVTTALLQEIDVLFPRMPIYDLTGLEDMNNVTSLVLITPSGPSKLDLSVRPNLEFLRIESEDLEELDLSSNLMLERLTIRNSQIENIDLSNNPNLRSVIINDGKLRTLDVSNNPLIEYLVVNRNPLLTLNIKNGNNAILRALNTVDNPLLSCIQVDAIEFAEDRTSWRKDVLAQYSTNCEQQTNLTYIPDDSFEQTLIDLGYDDLLDDYVLTATLETIADIDFKGVEIADLTGIESMLNLIVLRLENGTFESIDLSNNTELRGITLGAPMLKTIDLSKNTKLETFILTDGVLENIDFSQNPALNLVVLSGNSLQTLDLSNQSELFTLELEDNQLTALNLVGAVNLSEMSVRNNPDLNCIQVSNVAAAVAQSFWLKDDTASYALDCTQELDPDGVVNTDTALEPSNRMTTYPTVTTGRITIDNPDNEKIASVSVSALNGTRIDLVPIHDNPSEVALNISGNTRGMYIIRVVKISGEQELIKIILEK